MQGWTALMTAAKQGRMDIAKALIAREANVNAAHTEVRQMSHLLVTTLVNAGSFCITYAVCK